MGRAWCFTKEGPLWDYCDTDGDLYVRLGDSDSDFDSAENCSALPALPPLGPHNAFVDTYTGASLFQCNASWHPRRYLYAGVAEPKLAASSGVGSGGSGGGSGGSVGKAPAKVTRPLKLCEVAAFTSLGVKGFTPIHGAFHYDPRGCNSGGFNPSFGAAGVAGGHGGGHGGGQGIVPPFGSSGIVTFDNATRCDVTPWYWRKKRPEEYNPLTSAVSRMVVAGNTTLRMRTHPCHRAGCPKPPPYVKKSFV